MSKLPYICDEEQIDLKKDLGNGFFLIRKKNEKKSNTYAQLKGFYVQSRVPKDIFLKLKNA